MMKGSYSTKPSFEALGLPYFVYGTLRPGFHNDHCWISNGAVDCFDGDVKARRFKMVGRGVPYAVYTGDDDDVIVGALICPAFEFDKRAKLRFALDRLESHPVHYTRVETRVETPNGVRYAWIYTPTLWEPGGEEIPSGDWAQVRRSRDASVGR